MKLLFLFSPLGKLFEVGVAMNLRKIRREKGLTQQEVADYLNIGRTTYTKYESGRHTPDIFVLEKLATLFNVTLDELVGRTFPAKQAAESVNFSHLLEKLGDLPPEDIREIESYIEFKHSKKNMPQIRSKLG